MAQTQEIEVLGARSVTPGPAKAGLHAWIALVLLMLAQMISQVDRAIINLVIGPIQSHYQISDTQFGTLQGLAFGLFYTVMALPIAALADRYQRRIVVGVGIAVFSFFTFFTGFARNFTQLFIARIGVGTGEASVSPAGYSLITDYFPARQLGRAMSLFTMSSFVGTSVAMIGGGALVGYLTARAAGGHALPLGMSLLECVFLAVAIPGLILAPCFFFLREPVRTGVDASAAEKLSLRALYQELKVQRRFLALMILAMAMVSTLSYAMTLWTPALFMRVYGWSPAHVGFWVGMVYLVGGIGGSYFAGAMVDRLTQRGVTDAPVKVAAFAVAGCGVTASVYPLMPSAPLSLLLFFPAIFFKAMPFACAPTALQLVVPNRLRAQLGAIYITLISIIGLVCGSIFVGLMTDYLFHAPKDVRYSLSLLVAIATPIMVISMGLARKPYRLLRQRG